MEQGANQNNEAAFVLSRKHARPDVEVVDVRQAALPVQDDVIPLGLNTSMTLLPMRAPQNLSEQHLFLFSVNTCRFPLPI